MLIELAIALLFFILILTISYALSVFGLFHEVGVKVGPPPIEFNGQDVAYKLERGAYSKSGHLFTDINGDLLRVVTEDKVAQLPMIGFYYDDPHTVEADRCRYAVGVIMDKETSGSETIRKELTEKGFSFMRLPAIDHVVHSTFPYVSAFSIFIAIRRVYPAIRAYIKDHNLCAHPCLEVYHENSMYFILPLSKQDSFYLFDEEEDGEDEGSSCSESESECSGSQGGSVEPDLRSHSLPLSGVNSRRDSTVDDDSSSVNHTSPASLAHMDSKRSSTASSFEELSATEATTNGNTKL